MKNSTPFESKNSNQDSINNKLQDQMMETNSKLLKQSSIDNILNYSKALSIRKTNGFGFIENILN